MSLVKFDPSTGFTREKAQIVNNVVLVYQNHAKTNQFMSTTRVIPHLPSSTRALDPVFHYSKLLHEHEVHPHCPAFSYIDAGVIKCVTHKSYTEYLRSLLVCIINGQDTLFVGVVPACYIGRAQTP